jgi:hypothetical protein
VLARKIRLRRNSIVYGGPFTHPAQLVRESKATMEDFHRFNVKENGGAVLQLARESNANYPPARGIFKAN